MTTLMMARIHVWNDILMMGAALCKKPGKPKWRDPVRHDPYSVLRWLRERKQKRRDDYFALALDLSRKAAP